MDSSAPTSTVSSAATCRNRKSRWEAAASRRRSGAYRVKKTSAAARARSLRSKASFNRTPAHRDAAQATRTGHAMPMSALRVRSRRLTFGQADEPHLCGDASSQSLRLVRGVFAPGSADLRNKLRRLNHRRYRLEQHRSIHEPVLQRTGSDSHLRTRWRGGIAGDRQSRPAS